MHAFQRRARHQGVRPWHLEQGGAFHHQERPEALAAVEARIAHGLDQPRRPAQFAVQRRRRQKLSSKTSISAATPSRRERKGLFLSFIASLTSGSATLSGPIFGPTFTG